jgi:cobalamin biosynthesis Mg chelatase CobN
LASSVGSSSSEDEEDEERLVGHGRRPRRHLSQKYRRSERNWVMRSLAPDGSILSDGQPRQQQQQQQQKKSSATGWIVGIVILVIIGCLVGLGFLGYNKGWFESMRVGSSASEATYSSAASTDLSVISSEFRCH